MKKPAIILWVVLGLILVIAAVIAILPHVVNLYLFGKAFGFVVSFIGGLMKFIIVAIIIIAILVYLFARSH